MQLVLCACDAVLPCAQYVQPTSFDLVILFLFWPCADYLALDMFDILYYRTFKFCVSALHILCICAYCILHIAYVPIVHIQYNQVDQLCVMAMGHGGA